MTPVCTSQTKLPLRTRSKEKVDPTGATGAGGPVLGPAMTPTSLPKSRGSNRAATATTCHGTATKTPTGYGLLPPTACHTPLSRVAVVASTSGRSTFVKQVCQPPTERVQAAGRLRAAPPAPVAEPATVGTQTREVLQETFEPARLRARRNSTPAVRAIVELIHRPGYQPAPSERDESSTAGS
jgi:hypothetical protein